jgi:hypothetical protein
MRQKGIVMGKNEKLYKCLACEWAGGAEQVVGSEENVSGSCPSCLESLRVFYCCNCRYRGTDTGEWDNDEEDYTCPNGCDSWYFCEVEYHGALHGV